MMDSAPKLLRGNEEWIFNFPGLNQLGTFARI